MSPRLVYCLSRYLDLRVLLGVLILFLPACGGRATTDFIKRPWLEKTTDVESNLGMIYPSCLDLKKVKYLLEEDDEFKLLNDFYKNKNIDLFGRINESIGKRNFGCKEENTQKNKEPRDSPLWASLEDRVLKDHQAIIVKEGSEIWSWGCFCKIKLTEKLSQDNLRSTLGMEKRTSTSITAPGSLSLSTRPLPAEQEPGGVFAGLKERAQAAVIEFGKVFANSKDPQKNTPEKAVGSLLGSLSPPVVATTISDTQRVDLTISAVVNSASIQDRFDYITAYLILPPLPGPVNGSVSLERILLLKFKNITMGRSDNIRKSLLDPDLRDALDRLQARVEFIDNLKTEPVNVDLGTIKSGGKVDLTAGQTSNPAFQATGITAEISGTEREDKIRKELGKRSAWFNSDRTLVRITQRGMQEATISGSFSNALTLKVPKTTLYVLELDEKDNEIGKVKNMKLKDVEQPLYKTLDAIGVVLGTVRIATPFEFKWWNPFHYLIYPFKAWGQSEPDGVAYTVIEGPVPLRLWNNRRSLWGLELRHLRPELDGLPAGIRRIGIFSNEPYAKQVVLFPDEKNFSDFIEALDKEKLRLKKHPNKNPNENWYEIVSDCTNKSASDSNNKPDIGKIWLGVEEEGDIRPFSDKETPVRGVCS